MTLIGSTSHLYINLGSTVIIAIFSLPKLKQSIAMHLFRSLFLPLDFYNFPGMSFVSPGLH